MSTWGDIITDALYEIGAIGIGEPIPNWALQLAVRKLNRIIDTWAARRVMAYSTTFQAFQLTAGHNPYLIGPSATAPDFQITGVRPVRLEGAALILNDVNPPVDSPIINVRDADWWNNQRIKTLTTNVPTDVYYEPAWPSGQLFFWPVPDFNYQMRLQLWVSIASVPILNNLPNLTATFSAPPAYELMAMTALAIDLAEPFRRTVTPTLIQKFNKATSAVEGNNAKSPRIASADHGTAGVPRGDFNYYSGMPS